MKIYLHIGYPKTGSTFLQYNFLNKLSQNFIGRPYGLEDHQIENLLTNSRYDEFQKNKKKIIHYYFSKFKKNKINILSIEDLLKFSFFQKKSQNNPHKNIKRLKEIFLKIGDVKVIFVIRSPNDLIKSFYNQYYYNDWKDNKIYHHNIMKYFKKKKIRRLENFILSLKFYKTFNLLRKNFGRNNVKLLFYEDLKYNFKFFKSDLLKFMKINRNLKIKNVTIHTSEDKNSYFLIFNKIKKKFLSNNYNLFEFKKNIYSIYIVLKSIYQNRKIKKYTRDIDLIEKKIKSYYRVDLLKFKNKSISDKLKKYKYFY